MHVCFLGHSVYLSFERVVATFANLPLFDVLLKGTQQTRTHIRLLKVFIHTSDVFRTLKKVTCTSLGDDKDSGFQKAHMENNDHDHK